MTDPDQDELVALRRRAYARDADIHLDPASLARLDELENAHRTGADEVSAPELPSASTTAVADPVSESTPEDSPPDPWWVVTVRRVRPWMTKIGRWVRGLRRSTVVIALGAVLVAAILLTALTLVQRVQTDPLQVGAVQIARLGIDAAYQSPFPDSFNPTASEDEIRGYQAFHGLRAVTGIQAFFYPYDESDSDCIVIYVESSLQVQDGGFSGSLFSSCAAGAFPPMLQFPIDFPELPEELAAAYPDARGVQFVYDRDNEEIVVFVDQQDGQN